MLSLVKDLYDLAPANRDFLHARSAAATGNAATFARYRKRVTDPFYPARGEGNLKLGEARKAIRECHKATGDIESAMADFMAKRRPPEEIRDKLDLGWRIEGQSVVIDSIRPMWRDESRKTEEPAETRTPRRSRCRIPRTTPLPSVGTLIFTIRALRRTHWRWVILAGV